MLLTDSQYTLAYVLNKALGQEVHHHQLLRVALNDCGRIKPKKRITAKYRFLSKFKILLELSTNTNFIQK